VRFALDTNIISYLWRQDRNVRARLEAVDPANVAVPSVVLAELVFGRHNNPSASAKLEVLIRDLRDAYPVLDFNASAADWYGLLRARFKAQPAPDRDLMIAATCLAHGHALVTHDTKDFGRIEELAVADWALA
jgi:predicted nucleic acid-binding protein